MYVWVCVCLCVGGGGCHSDALMKRWPWINCRERFHEHGHTTQKHAKGVMVGGGAVCMYGFRACKGGTWRMTSSRAGISCPVKLSCIFPNDVTESDGYCCMMPRTPLERAGAGAACFDSLGAACAGAGGAASAAVFVFLLGGMSFGARILLAARLKTEVSGRI
jgi:hypothetical protein